MGIWPLGHISSNSHYSPPEAGTGVDRLRMYPTLCFDYLDIGQIGDGIGIRKNLKRMLDDICSRIPYILGELDEMSRAPPNTRRGTGFAGYTSIWTFRVALMAQGLGFDRKRFTSSN